MSTQLVIGNIDKGYTTKVEPFLLSNDAFPVLNNAFVWRKRVLRKRGNAFLGRLQRSITETEIGTTDGNGDFSGNIFTILGINASTLSPDAAIRPGSITITVGAETFIEPADPDGTLIGDITGTGTIVYQTGALTLTGAPATTDIFITLEYYPDLPVMGLESFDTDQINFPRLIAFDTRYSYEIDQSTDTFYDVNFYRNSAVPFIWTGQNYQQFWTANYQRAMFTTNGRAGFHFATIVTLNAQGPTTTVTITLSRSDLVEGDMLFFNELQGTTITGINERVGEITDATAAPTYVVTFQANVTIAGYTAMTGIAQLLTNSSDSTPTQDGIKWYDGDPTVSINNGWVNFMPPLSALDAEGMNPTNPNPSYLAGAQAILPFKGRLLFFDVTIAEWVSYGNYNLVRYRNRVVYSQDGTPFYTVNNDTAMTPALVPTDQTADPFAWAQNRAGRGGFIGAPVTQTLVSVQENEDVIIAGFETRQLKLVFTGDDALPFIFQTINSELGAQSTFSGVSLDTGALTFGEYGFALTTQVSAQRIDLDIPDQVFDVRRNNNDDQRVTAIRDYRNEWIYFTYCPNTNTTLYPSKTLLYNYRDNTWATFDENYTTYGTFRRTLAITWADLGEKYGTWAGWNDPWNFGSTEQQYPNIVGGNQQGFVMIRDSGTFEAKSEYIQDIDYTDPTAPIITSPDHGLDSEEFIEILDCIGVDNINEVLFQITVNDADTFTLLLNDEQLLLPPTGTYLGDGTFRRISRPIIQTKQFPAFWEQGKQTRVGTQRYFLQSTDTGEITVLLFMSQADNFPVNDEDNSAYQIYSQTVLTYPEPESRYPPDANQIWHRVSSSFMGDTVQIGITLTDAQMRINDINSAEIELHAMIFDLYPGPILS